MSGTNKRYGSNSAPSQAQRHRHHPPNTRIPSNRRNRPPAVLCDFDDTTAMENVAELLLQHFSQNEEWQRLRRSFREKKITFMAYQEKAFTATGATREAMAALVREKATLRPYFKQLWEYCRNREIPLAIVSVGLDFYVDALLEREELEDVPRYTVNTSFAPEGIAFEYPNQWDGSGASTQDVCSEWGNCKCAVLSRYKRSDHRILYVGDGRSDFCPASIADYVLARGPLVDLCRENGMPFSEFRDFRDVVSCLESWPQRDRQDGALVPSEGRA